MWQQIECRGRPCIRSQEARLQGRARLDLALIGQHDDSRASRQKVAAVNEPERDAFCRCILRRAGRDTEEAPKQEANENVL